MPANPKYLSSNKERFLRISAAILGGYITSFSIHLALATLIKSKLFSIIFTSIYTTFFSWISIIIFCVLVNKTWKAWGYQLVVVTISIFITLTLK